MTDETERTSPAPATHQPGRKRGPQRLPRDSKRSLLARIRSVRTTFEELGCLLCGETDPRTLTFRHRPSETYRFRISDAPSLPGMTLDALNNELSKCVSYSPDGQPLPSLVCRRCARSPLFSSPPIGDLLAESPSTELPASQTPSLSRSQPPLRIEATYVPDTVIVECGGQSVVFSRAAIPGVNFIGRADQATPSDGLLSPIREAELEKLSAEGGEGGRRPTQMGVPTFSRENGTNRA